MIRLPDHHRAWPLCPREKNSSVGVTPFHTVAQSVTESESLGIRIAIAGSFAVRQPSFAGKAVFAGKSSVVTGTLSKYTRDQMHELIDRHGGRASSSVSGKTDYLLAGEKAGSKLAMAEELGVSVISETDFERMIEDG